MGRSQFTADLEAICKQPPLGVTDVRSGTDNGHVDFRCVAGEDTVRITAMVPETSDYPTSHEYYFFCDSHAPAHIAFSVENIKLPAHDSLYNALDHVSRHLNRRLLPGDQDSEMVESESDEDFGEDEDDQTWFDERLFENTRGHPTINPPSRSQTAPSVSKQGITTTTSAFLRQRVSEDLKACKDAGFRIGHLGDLFSGNRCFVTVSIRICRLGVSSEALKAWKLRPNEYLILIIKYPDGYRPYEDFQSVIDIRCKHNLNFRILSGNRYKPDLQSVIRAFGCAPMVVDSAGCYAGDTDLSQTSAPNADTRETFISKSLNNLLEERLVQILRFRTSGMSWHGAEMWWHDVLNKTSGSTDAISATYYEPEPYNPALPRVVQEDHFQSNGSTTNLSFPLLAMQFMLRHFVRCTEFCLNCHRQLSANLQAIKPYVCEDPLCLYQYMSLGFGQSIEHEILTQPHVVDLLISFCYAAAGNFTLNHFPDGLGLSVPPLASDWNRPIEPLAAHSSKRPKLDTVPTELGSAVPLRYSGYFDHHRHELTFENADSICRVRIGDWILLTVYRSDGLPHFDAHTQVKETAQHPTIQVSKLVGFHSLSPGRSVYDLSNDKRERFFDELPRLLAVSFSRYGSDLDLLSVPDKRTVICRLLESLPSVNDMQIWLKRDARNNLGLWVERISPSALGLLRWIISSNRACIMQTEPTEAANQGSKHDYDFSHHRVQGMPGYMQFRFAMGAPDKERRFQDETSCTTERLKLQYPSIFAWHGSKLSNWHSIIRDGLNFNQCEHGRAYGNGVYHARDVTTSEAYSRGSVHTQATYNTTPSGFWPNSALRIASAVALNEIVNATGEFVSAAPFYVVSQLDWIQTRYLFVQITSSEQRVNLSKDDPPPSTVLEQDPKRTPTGINRVPIVIPGRLQTVKAKDTGGGISQTVKGTVTSDSEPSQVENDFKSGTKSTAFVHTPIADDRDDSYESDTTYQEDRDLLFETDDDHDAEGEKHATAVDSANKPITTGVLTAFQPDTLQLSTLPLMPMPEYATPQTTKRLLTELRSLSMLQSKTPLVELGWHVPVDQIENVYQWIVELHSFNTFSPKHPLVVDMQAAGVTSIVLEVRFGKDFPYSPPYIRVVKPKFLPFLKGGGGHIVQGGAMCMELLTNNGWSAICSMESVLMQVRMAIGASEPPARLERCQGGAKGASSDSSMYGVLEAAEGYLRACRAHGWEVPAGFQEIAYMGSKT